MPALAPVGDNGLRPGSGSTQANGCPVGHRGERCPPGQPGGTLGLGVLPDRVIVSGATVLLSIRPAWGRTVRQPAATHPQHGEARKGEQAPRQAAARKKPAPGFRPSTERAVVPAGSANRSNRRESADDAPKPHPTPLPTPTATPPPKPGHARRNTTMPINAESPVRGPGGGRTGGLGVVGRIGRRGNPRELAPVEKAGVRHRWSPHRASSSSLSGPSSRWPRTPARRGHDSVAARRPSSAPIRCRRVRIGRSGWIEPEAPGWRPPTMRTPVVRLAAAPARPTRPARTAAPLVRRSQSQTAGGESSAAWPSRAAERRPAIAGSSRLQGHRPYQPRAAQQPDTVVATSTIAVFGGVRQVDAPGSTGSCEPGTRGRVPRGLAPNLRSPWCTASPGRPGAATPAAEHRARSLTRCGRIDGPHGPPNPR